MDIGALGSAVDWGLAILKGLMFFGPFNTWIHWLGLVLYGAVALVISSYLIKRPT